MSRYHDPVPVGGKLRVTKDGALICNFDVDENGHICDLSLELAGYETQFCLFVAMAAMHGEDDPKFPHGKFTRGMRPVARPTDKNVIMGFPVLRMSTCLGLHRDDFKAVWIETGYEDFALRIPRGVAKDLLDTLLELYSVTSPTAYGGQQERKLR
jgi:hypothetical protein